MPNEKICSNCRENFLDLIEEDVCETCARNTLFFDCDYCGKKFFLNKPEYSDLTYAEVCRKAQQLAFQHELFEHEKECKFCNKKIINEEIFWRWRDGDRNFREYFCEVCWDNLIEAEAQRQRRELENNSEDNNNSEQQSVPNQAKFNNEKSTNRKSQTHKQRERESKHHHHILPMTPIPIFLL